MRQIVQQPIAVSFKFFCFLFCFCATSHQNKIISADPIVREHACCGTCNCCDPDSQAPTIEPSLAPTLAPSLAPTSFDETYDELVTIFAQYIPGSLDNESLCNKTVYPQNMREWLQTFKDLHTNVLQPPEYDTFLEFTYPEVCLITEVDFFIDLSVFLYWIGSYDSKIFFLYIFLFFNFCIHFFNVHPFY